MTTTAVSIEAHFVLPAAPAEELDRVTRTIRRELTEVHVERAELLKGPPVSGAKSAEAVTLGALALVVLPAVLPKVVDLLQQWMNRKPTLAVKLKLQHEGRSVEVELPLTPDAPEQLQALMKVAKQGIED